MIVAALSPCSDGKIVRTMSDSRLQVD